MKIKIQGIFHEWGSLFLISCLSLFMELAVIRWVSGEIRLLAYFKNLVLLAAFLGLAIGFAVVGKGKDYKGMFPWLWSIFVILVLVTGKTAEKAGLVYPGGGDEAFWGTSDLSFWFSLIFFIAFVIVFFFITLFLFIPLGQATGEEMAKHLPIPAYIINILASLVGVWLFSLLSYFNAPPVIWFVIGLIGFGIYYAIYHKMTWIISCSFVLTLLGIGFINPKTIWSPYNRLDLSPIELEQGNNKLHFGYLLTVQHYFYQVALDLSDNFVEKARIMFPELSSDIYGYVEAYNLPYSLAPASGRVLIVGSGMGNDVAAALRAQLEQVTAVEIDPTILALGRKFHPEKPYSDPRVTAIVDDARSFFEKNQNMYDLIVFGLLDSHTLLSSMASVRLDSYVYTIESFQQAKSHLSPNGYITLTFAANPWIKERLGRMLVEVFGQDNIYYQNWSGGVTFLAGDNLPRSSALQYFSQWKPDPEITKLPLASDNWPYIYLRSLRIPAGYWQTLLVIGLLCLFLMARSFPDALKPNWHFWLLGAAFLLIEFKSITELALLFGTTWFVNSIAISGVLIMALFANLYVFRTIRINLRWVYGLLFASLFLGYFFPLAMLSGYSPLVKGIIGTAILTLPLLFSGVIFSESLKRYGETSKPMASNFSGSAVGGVLEYGSIWWGIKGLYLVAVVLYIGAMIAAIKERLLAK
jgi:Spermine/spermidine synthase domain